MVPLNKTHLPLSVCERGMTQGLVHMFNVCIYVLDVLSVKTYGNTNLQMDYKHLYSQQKLVLYNYTYL
jgi:hypothetical protein